MFCANGRKREPFMLSYLQMIETEETDPLKIF